MSAELLACLAFFPILLPAIPLVGFHIPALKAMPFPIFITIIIAYEGCNISSEYILASVIQGLFITFDILYIIFAAIALLNLLKYTAHIGHKGGVYQHH